MTSAGYVLAELQASNVPQPHEIDDALGQLSRLVPYAKVKGSSAVDCSFRGDRISDSTPAQIGEQSQQTGIPYQSYFTMPASSSFEELQSFIWCSSIPTPTPTVVGTATP
uniref:Uncharacterized protein n=1 Tax=Thermogemmatispora argillosa TaxID=2045280 RepID=A0A455T6L2_9CHLR|nr:hypothetical protein KTA_15930 [Thermogemmatispora argillosa]